MSDHERHATFKEKVHTVMSEFKQRTLRSGSGQVVRNPKQAIAIALSEARKRQEDMHYDE